MEPIALERWLALGGTGRTHDVTVLPAAAATGGMDSMELAAPGHGFTLSTDAAGATWLAGRPNLAAGDYQWRLNARDAAGQHERRGWKFRVTPRAYVSLEGLDIVAGHADLAAGAVENPDPNDPTVSLPADQPPPIGPTSSPARSIPTPPLPPARPVSRRSAASACR